mmetsp:Transcript_14916/g.24576  ORF Transcript_14916/g.24576 Transcript_14916/m.24576 type:complete len:95 (-) Transcript_14916:661-945(-)
MQRMIQDFRGALYTEKGGPPTIRKQDRTGQDLTLTLRDDLDSKHFSAVQCCSGMVIIITVGHGTLSKKGGSQHTMITLKPSQGSCRPVRGQAGT